MPAGLTRDEVIHIARLANLELDPREIDLFARQLGDILAYAGELQQIDTTGVAPTSLFSGVSAGPSDRPDEVRPCLDPALAIANAPDAARDTAAGSFFKVPRVIG